MITPSDIRLSRRVLRDYNVHKRSIDYIIKQYLDFGMPMHEMFVEPQKKNADIIISGIIPIESSINVLIKNIKAL